MIENFENTIPHEHFKEGAHFSISTEFGGFVEIGFTILEIYNDFATVLEKYHNSINNKSTETVHTCRIEHHRTGDVMKIFDENGLRIELYAKNFVLPLEQEELVIE